MGSLVLGVPWDKAGNQLLSEGVDSMGFICLQHSITSAWVHKHRLEVAMAEPVLLRPPKILHCKLCLQLAINLPKV